MKKQSRLIAINPGCARLVTIAGLVLICVGLAAPLARAADYKFGINAEVSYKESESTVRRRYAPFLEELGKVTGHKFSFAAVYSDRVAQAVDSRQFDLLMIHTHLALKAEKSHQYQVVGFSDDRKNNQVYFFAKTDSPINTLADIAAASIGVPGMQSWATATALATLKSANAVPPRLVTTRYQEAVPFMLELNTVGVGISRSKSLVDEHVSKKKVRVLHQTPPMPLNALIAASGVPVDVVTDIRNAMVAMSKTGVYDDLGFKGLRFSNDESAQLHRFYQ